VKEVKQQFKENLYNISFENLPIIPELNTLFEVIGRKENSLVLKIHEGHAPNDVLNFFLKQQQNILSFQEILPSLNDIFIKLVEGTPLARQFEKITA
ncbi:MAG: DUF4162 domain-containing protein, partial [Chitinophagaceae bacterium]